MNALLALLFAGNVISLAVSLLGTPSWT